ncbi:MAG: SGNH/GDSL hydrolase family protein [Sphingobacteriaceae bacterium]|nr:SGNH/GDSL hydrolase family protein [Sphingobacteriaceae bacterium]
MNHKTSRRIFLKSSAIAGIATAFQVDRSLASDITEQSFSTLTDGKELIILFQGDSITDGNRGRNKDPNHIMGHGYAFSVASRVGADFPESKLTFYNRGISGNKVSDLKNRWQADTLSIKPNVLSILVGINDTSSFLNQQNTPEENYNLFETNYRDILNQSRQQNPDTLFVIGLPFAYPVAKLKDKWSHYRDTLAELTVRIKKLAKEFDAVIVNFPAVFDKASKKAPIEYWMWDGIHPTVPGHELMAREWIKQVSARLKFLKSYKYK